MVNILFFLGLLYLGWLLIFVRCFRVRFFRFFCEVGLYEFFMLVMDDGGVVRGMIRVLEG